MKKRADGLYCKQIRINGKQQSFYGKTIAEINKKVMEFKQNTVVQEQKKHKFKIIADEMLESKAPLISFQTLETYKNALKKMKVFYDMDIEEITASNMQELILALYKKNFSRSTIQKVKVTYGLVCKHAIQNDIKIINYSRDLTIPKRLVDKKKKALDDEQIKTIINNYNIPFGFFALTLLFTGLRRGECAYLQKHNIDLKKNIISIEGALEFQNGKAIENDFTKTPSGIRKNPILNIYKPFLEEYMKNVDTYLFGNTKPLSETQINKRWKKYCLSVGFENITMHQLRHTYAKMLYRAGVDPKTAQNLLGHADIKTTLNIYTEFSKDVTENAVDKINKFMNNLV